MAADIWSREMALNALKEAIRSLDGEYDDDEQVFINVRSDNETLVATVEDATDEEMSEEFVVTFK